MILKLTNVEHLFDVRACSTNMFNFWANAQDEHLQCAETFSNNSLPFTPFKLQKKPKTIPQICLRFHSVLKLLNQQITIRLVKLYP